MNSTRLCCLMLLLLMCSVGTWAQTTEALGSAAAVSESASVPCKIVFKSGRVVTGEVVQKNAEVVIVKDKYGSRFQFPVSDIESITELGGQQAAAETEQAGKTSRSLSNVKRTSLGVRVAGGVATLDHSPGWAVAADVRLGANNVGGRRIFLGGQVGYRALMAEGKTLSIIPIDAVMELPLMQGDHVPMLGANIGYGIGIGGIRGGVNAGLSLAYRYHFSRTGALHVGVGAEVQQLASVPHNVQVEPEQIFASTAGRTAVMGLITLGVLF